MAAGRYVCGPINEVRAAVSGRKKMIDKDRIVGSSKVVKGNVKEAIGKALGDAKLEAQGKADKIEGKFQNAVGGFKDAFKGK
jgi:uncharacterized protein YjbJ (UPF0337 family)